MTEPELDKARIEYVSDRWNVSRNCAKALQLFELGFSTNGISKALGVNHSTARGYKNELQEKIDPDVILTITRDGKAGKKFDVWGNERKYVGDYVEYEDRFKELPRNEGSISEKLSVK